MICDFLWKRGDARCAATPTENVFSRRLPFGEHNSDGQKWSGSEDIDAGRAGDVTAEISMRCLGRGSLRLVVEKCMANVHWAVHLISEPFVAPRGAWVGGSTGIWNLDARGCGLILPYRAYVCPRQPALSPHLSPGLEASSLHRACIEPASSLHRTTHRASIEPASSLASRPASSLASRHRG
jgi:hypothetical protein